MQKVKTFESNILLGGIMLILAHPADNHEAFPSTSHLDHEDDNDNDNDNHNHDNDDDNHDHDHDEDHHHGHDDDDHHGQVQVTSKRVPRQVDASHFEPLIPHLLVGR